VLAAKETRSEKEEKKRKGEKETFFSSTIPFSADAAATGAFPQHPVPFSCSSRRGAKEEKTQRKKRRRKRKGGRGRGPFDFKLTGRSRRRTISFELFPIYFMYNPPNSFSMGEKGREKRKEKKKKKGGRDS